jgi:hypothetical protein
MRVRVTASVLAVAVVCAGVTLGGTGAGAATYPAPGSVVPDKDPFYAAPSNLAALKPGAVVASRPVSIGAFGGQLVNSWQIAYRTEDSHDKPELTVTTLVVPKTPWLGSGARPAISIQAPEDSVGTQCSPSYTLATNSDEQDPLLGANAFLAAGYAIALPDHEGPKSVFLAGPEEGHAVLDGIRAVKTFGHGITRSNPWALDGYSGGANATAWAAQLQPTYAPDVPLVGAAMGGTPSDPAAVARSLDGGLFAGFEFAGAAAVSIEWPEAKIPSVLNAAGKAAFADVTGKCETDILSAYAGKKLADYATVPDPLVVPSVAKILALDTAGSMRPATPIYDYHADTDEIVPVAQDNALVKAWCGEGATVVEVRDLVGEHVEEAVLHEPDVFAWLTARFHGRGVTSTC